MGRRKTGEERAAKEAQRKEAVKAHRRTRRGRPVRPSGGDQAQPRIRLNGMAVAPDALKTDGTLGVTQPPPQGTMGVDGPPSE